MSRPRQNGPAQTTTIGRDGQNKGDSMYGGQGDRAFSGILARIFFCHQRKSGLGAPNDGTTLLATRADGPRVLLYGATTTHTKGDPYATTPHAE